MQIRSKKKTKNKKTLVVEAGTPTFSLFLAFIHFLLFQPYITFPLLIPLFPKMSFPLPASSLSIALILRIYFIYFYIFPTCLPLSPAVTPLPPPPSPPITTTFFSWSFPFSSSLSSYLLVLLLFPPLPSLRRHPPKNPSFLSPILPSPFLSFLSKYKSSCQRKSQLLLDG